ncbi:hypothetical protein [Streptomyces sp. ISL-100]|uniref:hypothetical protein n=1 Tax=Streptomyces sp. ISL-100 TaxID=2819173 RepID=UPI001BE657B2|nr:hypothetical protein [Streptomyces sp. ISL-100]MBT2397064.1 hypothetical protein [Streptomyces sp. ISL-100]
MRCVPAVTRTAAALLLVSLAAVGCSNATQGEPSDSAQPKAKSPTSGASQTVVSDEMRAYFDCLKDNGLTLETTDGGEPRVEKGTNSDAATIAAEKKCVDLRSEPTVSALPKDQLAKARELSACIREKGIKNYPDPDAKGNVQLSAELAKSLKANPDFPKAEQECQPDSSDGDTVVGG